MVVFATSAPIDVKLMGPDCGAEDTGTHECRALRFDAPPFVDQPCASRATSGRHVLPMSNSFEAFVAAHGDRKTTIEANDKDDAKLYEHARLEELDVLHTCENVEWGEPSAVDSVTAESAAAKEEVALAEKGSAAEVVMAPAKRRWRWRRRRWIWRHRERDAGGGAGGYVGGGPGCGEGGGKEGQQ